MTTRGRSAYVVTVEGHLDEHWADWLELVSLTHQDDGTSTLVASPADQAALHGLLARLRDLGVTLVAVVPAPDSPTPNPPGTIDKE